jgi:hypothetical protein
VRVCVSVCACTCVRVQVESRKQQWAHVCCGGGRLQVHTWLHRCYQIAGEVPLRHPHWERWRRTLAAEALEGDPFLGGVILPQGRACAGVEAGRVGAEPVPTQGLHAVGGQG